MWIITGPFDSETSNEVGFQKSKLLKSGKSYLIGRKSTADLVVNHKKVSHDHGQFVVGGFSPDDVTNTDYAPTLRILNSKNKTMRILREGVPNGVIVNPGATEQLQHDDQVDIVSGLPLTVQWRRICCFETPGKVRTPVPIDGCASIGVHIVRTLHPDITHHLVPSYALTPAHMTSLLFAAQLVKPEWLSDLLELSILDPHESQRALEYTFALPAEGKYRPTFVATLPTALKTFKTWEPNETRLNMMKGYRFVFVGDKGLEIPAGYRDLVKRGGADYEAFSVNAGVVRWRKALLRAKALAEEKNGKAVPVADGSAMELAVGMGEWEEMVSVPKSLGLEFIQPENILQAVAFVDTFYVESARATNSQAQGSGESSLPDVVPNTFPGEPSKPPPIQRENSPKATRPSPTTSEQAPSAATSLPETTGVSRPRRLPPRRAMGTNHTAPSPGPADDVAIVAATPTPVPPLAPVQGDAALGSTQLPTPVSQTRRLPPRRRANQGVDPSSALMSASSHPQAPQSQFSQLDKFKALFDASNPDRVPSDETQPGMGTGTGTSTQGFRASTLSAVPEEEQGSQAQPTGLRGTKRSRGGDDGDDDAEMTDGAADAIGTSADILAGSHRAKRRAVDDVPAPAPQPRSTQPQTQTQATGTTTGTKQTTKPVSSKSSTNNKLDTDENFLRAVNSTKRGKKLEDDFDREFNLLRIAKPKKVDGAGTGAATATAAGPVASAPEVVVAPWDAIDDFGDVGIRGNFMVVVEMDIERGSAKHSHPAHINNDDITTHPEWVGRPNFKKFKSKKAAAIERRQTIELVISEENDYGIGNAYWRSGASGSQSHSDVHDITAAHPPPLHNKGKSKPPSKASRAPISSRSGRARAPASEHDEDENEVTGVNLDADEMDLDDASAAPLKPASTRGRSGTRAKAPASAATAAKKPASKAKPTAKAKGKSTTAKTKTKRSPARTKKAPTAARGGRRKNAQAQALFLSDDDSDNEDEFVVGSEEDEMDDDMPVAVDESAAAVAAVLGVGEDEEEEAGKEDETMTRGTSTLAHGGHDERMDIGTTATLRSTAGTQSRREVLRAGKRRAPATGGGDDDDSDDAVFKGFGGRKRGRVR